MSRNALELVFPAAIGLLVCTLVVLFLTATGLAPNSRMAWEAEEQFGCGVVSDVGYSLRAQQDSSRLAALSPAEAEVIAAGDALFKENCAQCHAIHDVVVGPALAGLEERRPMPWLFKWVRNSSKMVAAGDDYAVKIYNEYQQQQMPSFALSDEEITSIIKYIKHESGAYATSVALAP